MPEKPSSQNPSLIPSQPVHAGAAAFVQQMSGLMDGQPKDDATVNKAFEGMDGMFDIIAAGLYSLASMMVGEGEESIQLVESAVANADIASTPDPEEARRSSRRALVTAAITVIAERAPESLAAPEDLTPAVTCIEDDDLDAAGVSRAELERMIAGPDRDRVRKWLEGLPTEMRVIFVMRAVAGLTTPETAILLAQNGGALAAGWTAQSVRELFRQALCSLASQLIHATISR